MKKITILILILIVLIDLYSFDSKKVIIPKDSIRFRVIANSNSKYDQDNKKKIAKEVSKEIIDTMKDKNRIEDARLSLKSNLGSFKTTAINTARKNNYNKKIEINYGQNYFPEKEYKDVKYKEGEYESLVIKLGEGKGDNFWCVLFPPLCLLEADEKETEKVEYKSFIKELIDKYF